MPWSKESERRFLIHTTFAILKVLSYNKIEPKHKRKDNMPPAPDSKRLMLRRLEPLIFIGFNLLLFSSFAIVFTKADNTLLKACMARRVPFNSTIWRASLESQTSAEPVRIDMVDDLLIRHKLTGASRAEIEQLLGKPPKTIHFSEYEYVYWLGPERRFMSIDSEWLCLKFSNNQVTEARILAD